MTSCDVYSVPLVTIWQAMTFIPYIVLQYDKPWHLFPTSCYIMTSCDVYSVPRVTIWQAMTFIPYLLLHYDKLWRIFRTSCYNMTSYDIYSVPCATIWHAMTFIPYLSYIMTSYIWRILRTSCSFSLAISARARHLSEPILKTNGLMFRYFPLPQPVK